MKIVIGNVQYSFFKIKHTGELTEFISTLKCGMLYYTVYILHLVYGNIKPLTLC